jgi:hypothetical protein
LQEVLLGGLQFSEGLSCSVVRLPNSHSSASLSRQRLRLPDLEEIARRGCFLPRQRFNENSAAPSAARCWSRLPTP